MKKSSCTNAVLGLSLCVFSVACSNRVAETRIGSPNSTPSATVATIVDVSMKQLMDNPKQYDAKPIRVIGYVYLEREGNIISEGPDKRYDRPVRDVWLEIDDSIRRDSARYHKQYVLVEGTFNFKNHGHLGLSVGSIENIKRFELSAAKA